MLDPARELRCFPCVEMRAEGGSGEITGYAAVFDQEAEIIPGPFGFREVIRRGAFARSIAAADADIFAFFNHDSGLVLGRTKNATLDLAEDAKGLRFTLRPADTPTAQEARNLIKQGFIDKMSFGFNVVKQQWTEIKDKPALRELLDVDLWEVSPVPFPAYGGTSADARRMLAGFSGPPDAVREMQGHLLRLLSAQNAELLARAGDTTLTVPPLLAAAKARLALLPPLTSSPKKES